MVFCSEMVEKLFLVSKEEAYSMLGEVNRYKRDALCFMLQVCLLYLLRLECCLQ